MTPVDPLEATAASSRDATPPLAPHDSTNATLPREGGLPDAGRVELQHPTSLGRYVILERLGQGGMGVVLAAYDPKLDRKVAIKLLHALRRDDTERRLRMEREAQAMARLTHPNVVTVYEVGEVADQLFVAMEFVRGQDLRGWLRDHPAADWCVGSRYPRDLGPRSARG